MTSMLGKLPNKAQNDNDCEHNKVVTFKSPTGTEVLGYGVTKGKPLSYPKTKYPGKYPGTDNYIIKTVMGSGPREEKTANKSEKWIGSQLLIYPSNQYYLTYFELLELV